MTTKQERIDALVDAIIDYETSCGSLDETTAEGYARLFLGSPVLREMRAEALREYRAALAGNESAANWMDRAAFLHDLDDWATFIESEGA